MAFVCHASHEEINLSSMFLALRGTQVVMQYDTATPPRADPLMLFMGLN